MCVGCVCVCAFDVCVRVRVCVSVCVCVWCPWLCVGARARVCMYIRTCARRFITPTAAFAVLRDNADLREIGEKST